jgi:hypothetical protein
MCIFIITITIRKYGENVDLIRTKTAELYFVDRTSFCWRKLVTNQVFPRWYYLLKQCCVQYICTISVVTLFGITECSIKLLGRMKTKRFERFSIRCHGTFAEIFFSKCVQKGNSNIDCMLLIGLSTQYSSSNLYQKSNTQEILLSRMTLFLDCLLCTWYQENLYISLTLLSV